MAEAQAEQGGGAGSAAGATKAHPAESSSEHDGGSTTGASDSSSEQGDTNSRASRVLGKGKEKADDEAKAPGGDHPSEDDDDEEEEEDDEEDDDDDDDEDEEDEEPTLKYARLTQSLAGVYRNGDATSAFLVAGDKMIVGTHNGNIHVFQLPACSPLRVYHAHSASITAISISPFPPPLPNLQPEQLSKIVSESAASSSRHSDAASASPSASPRGAARRHGGPPAVLNTPSNNIYIATASTDGNVCVQSLVDIKDVQLRSFGRPVQAVALSPDYRQDRTYLSGGLAGSLVLTVGGPSGRSTSTTVGTAAAAASGWLGSMGLGANTGRDTVLHAGEGTVSTIQWSLSGQYAAWLNEHGIKIMRTKTRLDSADAESAWKRIGHIDRPATAEWDAMATAWRGRAQWIDESTLEADEATTAATATAKTTTTTTTSPGTGVERLLVGWGSTIWIVHVHPGGVGVGRHAGERSVGHAEIVHILRMDCIISGLSLYTQNLLLVLAYCLPENEEEDSDDDDHHSKASSRGHKPQLSTASGSSGPTGGLRRRRLNNLPPELRLIDLASQAEVDKDVLGVSRFERLAAADYHLGVLPAQTAATAAVAARGTLEALTGLGAEMWNAAVNPKMLFSSGTSIASRGSNEGGGGSVAGSTARTLGSHASTLRGASSSAATAAAAASAAAATATAQRQHSAHPALAKPGIKVFIHSPYDCILATKRDLADHLAWLLEHEEYQKAWELVDEHPEAVEGASSSSEQDDASTAEQGQGSDDFFADAELDAASRAANAPAEREKQRIGELWIKALVDAGDWARAGAVCGRVLRRAERWAKWVWAFAGAEQFDAIADAMPREALVPPLAPALYEVVLGHYLQTDRPRFRALLAQWPPERGLYDVRTVVAALENQLRFRDVREDGVEDGERGRDWRIVLGALVRLHEAQGRQREALRCALRLADADTAFRLIRAHHLADAVADDIPRFFLLRVPAADAAAAAAMPAAALEAASAEAVTLLVDEAQHGLVRPATVVGQLQAQELDLFTFLYLRGLWRGAGLREHQGDAHERLAAESRVLVDGFADLAVRLFARFDRGLLMEYLQQSTAYSFERATAECEHAGYVDELVYLYAKTGQMKRALYLIIDRLGDVGQAIAFAKQQNDPDLWEDLLTYSMDKPRFIRGLLEQVGTAIDPITLVRRIPAGLEVEGLREGLRHIMKEHEIQHSLSAGVAQILRSEVSQAQARLRRGQSRGIKFGHTASADSSGSPSTPSCSRCGAAFAADEADLLVGFACGHVFHLGHLLDLAPDEAAALGLGGGGSTDDDDAAAADRLRSRRTMLGTKITHARLLKDRIRDGCPECRRTDDSGLA